MHTSACGPRADAGVPGTKVSKTAPPVNTGLAALASNAEAVVLPPPDPTAPMTDAQKSAWAQQSALNLEQLLREGAVDDFGRPRTTPTPAATASAPSRPTTLTPRIQPTPLADAPANTGLGALAAQSGLEGAPDAGTQQPTPPPVTEHASVDAPPPAHPASAPQISPLADLASRMASLLRPAPGKTKPALTDAAALTPIEAMQPGVLAALDRADSPLASLPPADLSTLRQARDRLLADAATPPDLLTALRGSESPAAALAPRVFSITRSALCTRVASFGRYDPYSSTTFVAGRPIRAIVYTELDAFATRPARSGDPLQTSVAMSEQVSVQLTQTLSLYNDKDGLLAWHRPPQSVTETSRSARRDFYLIQIIELPPTLSIGRYNLKVTVADATSGAEAESIIPIDIVADPSLVLRSR
jgi:hypothetical protein